LEKDLVGCFNTSDEFVTTLSSSSRELRKYQKEQAFINRLVQGDLGLQKEKKLGIGDIEGTITRENIVKALIDSGLVRNANSVLGKYQVSRNIRKVHQTDYWRGYSFKPASNEPETYKVELEDISGLDPG